MKEFDYSVIKDSGFYDRARPFGKALSKLFYKVCYTGLENIPKEGGFILASNHMCAIDPGFIGLAIEDRQIHFMGKKELFEKPIIGTFYRKLNGFPVNRGGAASQSVNYAIRLVKEGNIFGIFPEGTRSKDHRPGKARPGVAKIAMESHADILPVAVYNCDEMKKHTKVTVRFGKLIPYSELGLTDESDKEELKAAADLIMSRITALWEEGHCE